MKIVFSTAPRNKTSSPGVVDRIAEMAAKAGAADVVLSIAHGDDDIDGGIVSHLAKRGFATSVIEREGFGSKKCFDLYGTEKNWWFNNEVMANLAKRCEENAVLFFAHDDAVFDEQQASIMSEIIKNGGAGFVSRYPPLVRISKGGNEVYQFEDYNDEFTCWYWSDMAKYVKPWPSLPKMEPPLEVVTKTSLGVAKDLMDAAGAKYLFRRDV